MSLNLQHTCIGLPSTTPYPTILIANQVDNFARSNSRQAQGRPNKAITSLVAFSASVSVIVILDSNFFPFNYSLLAGLQAAMRPETLLLQLLAQ